MSLFRIVYLREIIKLRKEMSLLKAPHSNEKLIFIKRFFSFRITLGSPVMSYDSWNHIKHDFRVLKQKRTSGLVRYSAVTVN